MGINMEFVFRTDSRSFYICTILFENLKFFHILSIEGKPYLIEILKDVFPVWSLEIHSSLSSTKVRFIMIVLHVVNANVYFVDENCPNAPKCASIWL